MVCWLEICVLFGCCVWVGGGVLIFPSLFIYFLFFFFCVLLSIKRGIYTLGNFRVNSLWTRSSLTFALEAWLKCQGAGVGLGGSCFNSQQRKTKKFLHSLSISYFFQKKRKEKKRKKKTKAEANGEFVQSFSVYCVCFSFLFFAFLFIFLKIDLDALLLGSRWITTSQVQSGIGFSRVFW